MKEKFTKGEWEVRKVRGFDYGSEYNGVGMIDANGHTMTVLSTSNLKAYDAHLIAQAPAMYEMLKTIGMVLDGKTEFAPDEIDTIAIDDLLAKARGES